MPSGPRSGPRAGRKTTQSVEDGVPTRSVGTRYAYCLLPTAYCPLPTAHCPSQTRIRKLPQRQLDRLLVPRAAGDGLGELHVTDAGDEVGVGDRPPLADGVHEVGLDPPTTPHLIRD